MENRTSKSKDSIFSHSPFSKNSRVCAFLYFSTPVLCRLVLLRTGVPPPLHFAESPEQSKGTGGGGAEVMRQIYYIKKKTIYTSPPIYLSTYIPLHLYTSPPIYLSTYIPLHLYSSYLPPTSLSTYIPPSQYSSLPHCSQFGPTPRPSKKVNRRGCPRPPVGEG